MQAETETMIPDTMRRLAAAVQDLQEFVVRGAAGPGAVAHPTRTPRANGRKRPLHGSSPYHICGPPLCVQAVHSEELKASTQLTAAKDLLTAVAPSGAGPSAGEDDERI